MCDACAFIHHTEHAGLLCHTHLVSLQQNHRINQAANLSRRIPQAPATGQTPDRQTVPRGLFVFDSACCDEEAPRPETRESSERISDNAGG